MTTSAWALLSGAGFLLAYHFVLYPVLMAIAARRAAPVAPAPTPDAELPAVSLIIAAYNEERVIGRKLRETLELDYPGERLQIIVVSDGSDDGTHAIAQSFADRGVLALHDPPRRGKSAALNRGVAAATGDVVLFSDANNHFSTGAIRMMVRHFRDARVGGVCGRKSILDAGDRQASDGDGLYWRYEAALKESESALGVMTTADGEIFAIRRRLWQPIPADVINDDAEITFALVRAGYRIVYEPDAVSSELASAQLEEDFRVKVRMIAGGFQTVQNHWRQLLPPTTLFAWAFLSHKLLRWLVPVLLLVALIASLALVNTPLGAFAVCGQVLFYGVACLGWFARDRGPVATWKYVPLYFSLMNVAALLGLHRFLAGHGVTAIWQKAAR